jgi:hypothetical protein
MLDFNVILLIVLVGFALVASIGLTGKTLVLSAPQSKVRKTKAAHWSQETRG